MGRNSTRDLVSIQLFKNHYAKVGLSDTLLSPKGRREFQVINFVSGKNVINSLNIIGVDPVTNINFESYYLSRIGVDSFKDNNFYILYLYSSNGEPEFYCYYNYKGELMAWQECTRMGCENHICNPDKSTFNKYLALDKPVMMKEIELIPPHYSH